MGAYHLFCRGINFPHLPPAWELGRSLALRRLTKVRADRSYSAGDIISVGIGLKTVSNTGRCPVLMFIAVPTFADEDAPKGSIFSYMWEWHPQNNNRLRVRSSIYRTRHLSDFVSLNGRRSLCDATALHRARYFKDTASILKGWSFV